jgi:hypothetical protein
MRIRLIPVLLALVAAAPVQGQSTWTYHSDGGYAVELPAHWTRVPDEALDAVRQSDPGEDATYEAGFRLTDAPWPAPPIAAIARVDIPTEITLEEFAAEFTAADAQAEMQDAIEETPAQGARVGVPRWDAATGAAWTRVTLRSDGATPAFAWSAMMPAPSRRAMIVLMYYGAPGADEMPVVADLKAIVRSLRVD